jgi:cullin 5
MRYAESKLREEEQRANKYLEPSSIATVSIETQCHFIIFLFIYFSIFISQLITRCVDVLVTAFKDTILAECASMIKQDETQSRLQTFCFVENKSLIYIELVRN